jgi:hypothetical protein
VEVSGEAATGSAASGAAASGGGPSAVNVHSTGSAHSSAAPGADGEARATGGGVERSEGAAVGEGGSGVVRICVDRSCFRGDNGGGVRGVGDVVVVERGDRTCGGGKAWRGERRSVFSPSSILSSSASHRLFTALLVRLAGGGDGVVKLRGVGESSGPEGLVGKDSGTRGACTTWFVASPTAVFRGRRRRRRRRWAV